MLEAVENGDLVPPGGVIQYRGRQIHRKDLPAEIRLVGAEIAESQKVLAEHDQRCRTLHLAIAGAFGGGWDLYLRGLLQLIHYAEHVGADLREAQLALAHVYSAETATRRVSSDGVNRLVAEGRYVHRRLSHIFENADGIVLDSALCSRLKVASWREDVGSMELPPPGLQKHRRLVPSSG